MIVLSLLLNLTYISKSLVSMPLLAQSPTESSYRGLDVFVELLRPTSTETWK